MKTKRYTRGGRIAEDGEYVCRRLIIHERDDEAIEAIADAEGNTVAGVMREAIADYIEAHR